MIGKRIPIRSLSYIHATLYLLVILLNQLIRVSDVLKHSGCAWAFDLKPAINPAGRVVIVVDDGLATGATMMAALRSVRLAKPLKLICAVPVSPPDTLARVAELADEMVCLQQPDDFEAVGQFYHYFPQVSDTEVIDILRARGTQ